jgi:hypothetical protein
MAKKNRKHTAHTQAQTLAGLSVDELKRQGEHYLELQKYQDALVYLKELSKRGGNSEHAGLLARAYIGRIRHLAEKSMLKEAVALLETLEQRCRGVNVDQLRMSLAFMTGDYGSAAELYCRCATELNRDEQYTAEALFGALLLAGVGLHPTDLPEQSPVVRHFVAARTALRHYCDGADADAREALKKLPFRSPYRDLRSLLLGLLALPADTARGRELLARIEPSSPYYRLVQRNLAALETPAEVLGRLPAVSQYGTAFLSEIFGFHVRQLQMLVELSQIQSDPVQLFGLVQRHRGCFPAAVHTALILRILPFCGGQTIKQNIRQMKIPETTMLRVCALASEMNGKIHDSVCIWDAYLEALRRTGAGSPLEKALILRYQAEMMRREDYTFVPEDIFMKYRESLDYDPGDAATWLKAAAIAKASLGDRQRYTIINEAVDHIPDNIDILVAAMQAAAARKSFKKAATLADRILAVDPINTSAMNFLVESRLEHGRKLALQRKWQLAEKEFKAADTRVRAIRFRGRNLLCLGMLFLLQNNDEGYQVIVDGRKAHGDHFPGCVLTAVEARLFALPAALCKRFDDELRQAAEEFERTDCLRLVNWILNFSGGNWLALKECCSALKNYFPEVLPLSWSLDEGQSLCRALDRIEHYPVLAQLAAELLKNYPGVPEFSAYEILGLYADNRKYLSRQDRDRLSRLIDELARKNRHELLGRLRPLLYRIAPSRSGRRKSVIEQIFRLPNKPVKKKKPKENLPAPIRGRQLNLFDDEQ